MIDKIKIREFEISKLMLGTVQFGLNYGIANKNGQVTYETARDIIACAYENGVNCLDTAFLYGTSEDVIGKALDELKITDKIIVVTKLPPLDNKYALGAEADKFVEESIKRSMERLKKNRIDFCFFHRDADAKYFDSLQRVKDMGLVKAIGYSVVMTPDAMPLLDGKSDALQIPFNIIDKRPFEDALFEKAISMNTAIFTRSVYLQGLLLMDDENILPSLKDIIPLRKKLKSIAENLGISLAELCMRYVVSTKGVSSVIVGVDTVAQMKQNISLFRNEPINQTIMDEIKEIIPLFPDHVLAPHLWRRN